MSTKVFRCRICGKLIKRDDADGFIVGKDLSVCDECNRKAAENTEKEKPVWQVFT